MENPGLGPWYLDTLRVGKEKAKVHRVSGWMLPLKEAARSGGARKSAFAMTLDVVTPFRGYNSHIEVRHAQRECSGT